MTVDQSTLRKLAGAAVLTDTVKKENGSMPTPPETETAPPTRSATPDPETVFQSNVDLDFDIVFVGSGFTSLAVASALRKKLSPAARFCFVSPEEAAGGVWLKAADGVRLHQQTHSYALPTCKYEDRQAQVDALHCASAKTVREYAQKVFAELGGTHVQGKVVDVTELDGGRARHVHVEVPEAGKPSKSITCWRVIQATGFDFYSGTPNTLGLPREVHSSQLQSEEAVVMLRGQKCLVVGSGKSAVDAMRFLVKHRVEARCLYRTPCAFVTMAFNGFYCRLLQCLSSALYFHYFLNSALCAARGVSDGWDYDYTLAKNYSKWFSFFIVGDGAEDEQTIEETRGGILRRSEYLLANWMLRVHGVRGDATKLKWAEVDGKVTCSAFPDERFDRVITCSGYKGTTMLLPNCIYALTPLIDMHMQSGWMMGHVIHKLLDDDELAADWNKLASLKSAHPWVGHYDAPRQWVMKHLPDAPAEAWASMRKGLIEACEVKPSSTRWTGALAYVDDTLAMVFDDVARVVVRVTWVAPKSVAAWCLRLFGVSLARC